MGNETENQGANKTKMAKTCNWKQKLQKKSKTSKVQGEN